MGDAFDQARQHFLDGLAHFQAHALTEAEHCFESALALMPGRPSTLTNLGATRVKLGKAGAALPLLEQATAAEPGNLQAWSYLALAHADLGQYIEALACYDKALALDGAAAAIWLQQAQALVRLGRSEPALVSL
ncbi:MAG: tetratricopeptide repeat protein, partial [Polaromonas sp.]|nr:tetratricopeptide repeat protein [Polaromonas sp.]